MTASPGKASNWELKAYEAYEALGQKDIEANIAKLGLVSYNDMILADFRKGLSRRSSVDEETV